MPSTPTCHLERLDGLKDLNWRTDVQLPVPPQSVIEFSSRSRKPDVTIAELSRIVECEPALAMELLRNVNSCVRGLRHKVDSVAQAIALLGIPNSTTILLTSALSCAMEEVDSPLIPSADFRRETVERATFSREVGRRMGLDPTISFTSGMLQDILLPMLTRRYQVEYHEYLHGATDASLVEFEQKHFGWTHAEITAKTLLDWGFSQALALSVLEHHDSPEQMLLRPQGIPQAFANASAALLVDVMNQSPDGVTRLVDLHEINPRFQLMDAAIAVDEAMGTMNSTLHHPVTLVHRLQNSMLGQIELRRRQSVVPGRQFGTYVLEEKLRESSMGAIFRARHIRLRRPAAMKILRAERMTAESIAQFEREVQITSALRHPNTVAIFDYGHTPDDLFYYAMELVDGLTLADLVKLEGPLCDGRAIHLLQQACGSLSEAHGYDLIHRDIKPENMMVSNRVSRPDHLTVLDFGLVMSTSTSNDPESTEFRGVVGTPLHMSPEAAHGRQTIDGRSDLYSLASVGYYLITGRPVFTGNSVYDVLQQHMCSTPTPPSERVDTPICPELEALLMQCLAKDPLARPASAIDLFEALTACVPIQPWTAVQGLRWWTEFEATLKREFDLNFGDNALQATMLTTQIGGEKDQVLHSRRSIAAPVR